MCSLLVLHRMTSAPEPPGLASDASHLIGTIMALVPRGTVQQLRWYELGVGAQPFAKVSLFTIIKCIVLKMMKKECYAGKAE